MPPPGYTFILGVAVGGGRSTTITCKGVGLVDEATVAKRCQESEAGCVGFTWWSRASDGAWMYCLKNATQPMTNVLPPDWSTTAACQGLYIRGD